MEKPAISITRLEGETDKAFEARKIFLLLGSDRTMDKVVQALNKKPSFIRHVMLWSARFQWREIAESYDNTIATLAAIDHAADEVQRQQARRERYLHAADKLLDIGLKMLERFQKELGTLEFTPTTLAQIGRAFALAQNLEAAVTPKDGMFNEQGGTTVEAPAKAYVGISPDDWDE